MEYKIVILGGGNAAGYLVNDLIKLEPSLKAKGQIAIISKENYVPYERPALSKGFLLGKAKFPGFATCAAHGESHDESWYLENEIAMLFGETCNSVDFDSKTCVLESGKSVKATDFLILVTGCSVTKLSDFNIPGSDCSNLYYMRDLDDGNALLEAMSEKKKWCVVGAGYMGMEVTAALVSSGQSVTMMFPDKSFMDRFMPAELGEFYEKLYKHKGVEIVKTDGAHVAEVVVGDDGKATHIKCNNDAMVEADNFFIGIGGRPNVQMFSALKQAERADGGGLLVNAQFETSAENVYAIGDIANFPLESYGGKQFRLEHVRCCRASASHCANAINAKIKGGKAFDREFDYIPNFYSRVFESSWEFWGQSEGDFTMIVEDESRVLAVWRANDNSVNGIFTDGFTDEEREHCRSIVEKKAQKETISTITEFLVEDTVIMGFGKVPAKVPEKEPDLEVGAEEPIKEKDPGPQKEKIPDATTEEENPNKPKRSSSRGLVIKKKKKKPEKPPSGCCIIS